MPVYRQRLILEIAKGLKAFVGLEAGVGRSAPWSSEGRPDSEQRGRREAVAEKNENLEKLRASLAKKNETIASLQRSLAEGDGGSPSPAPAQEKPGGNVVDPRNIVWIFGTGRGGSTWLRSMMSELEGHRVWEEPMVGRLFGDFHKSAQRGQSQSKSFVLGEPARQGWIESIRLFILNRVSHLYYNFTPDNFLVVKEPNGSVGAPLIMEALPESRMVCLVRDPRDVAASVIDATKKGSWMYERKSRGDWKDENISDTEPDVMARRRAHKYVEHVGNAKKAYEEHKGPKVLVRYEDLVAEPLSTMRRLYAELGIPVEDAEIQRAVEKHSWANIPEEKKGEGKFYRKGTSGSWKEDLDPSQISIVERITSSLLEELYPETGAAPRES